MTSPQNKVVIKNEIAHFFHSIFTVTPKKRHYITKSGRACTKSTMNAMLMCVLMLYYKNVDAIVIAYEYGSLVDKAMGDIQKALGFLKIPQNRYTIKTSDNGQLWVKFHLSNSITNTIHFQHGKGGAERLKGINPNPGQKWIMAWYYELTNFIGYNAMEIANINSTWLRNCHPSFTMRYEYNTPKASSPGAWVIEFEKQYREREDCHFQMNTYLDMFDDEKKKFLTQELLNEIKNLKKVAPLEYDHVYLGKDAYSGDQIYYNLTWEKHYGEHENFNPDSLHVGIDIGRSDATVCVLRGYEYINKPLRISDLKIWYHSNRRMIYEKNNDPAIDGFLPHNKKEYLQMIWDFLEECHNEYPDKVIYFQMDTAGEGQAWYDDMIEKGIPYWLVINRQWKNKFDWIGERIDTHLLIFGLEGCYKTKLKRIIRAFESAVYDKNRKRLDNGANILLDPDTIDATEYTGTKEMYKDITTRILQLGG